MTKSSYDVVILGAGPGGYVCAIRAAQNGQKVAVIEEKHLGGVCLNWGCIPTKALLRTSEIYDLMHHADDFGLSLKGVSMDFSKIIERSRKVSNQLASGVKHLLKKNKVDVISGRGTFAKEKEGGFHVLEVRGEDDKVERILGKNIVVATGAHARRLPGLLEDPDYIWSAKEAMIPQKLPKKLLIIGSGAIGIEFASFYNAMGTEVTVVELQERILPVEDIEISTFARKAFEKKGIKIYTNSSAEDIKIEKAKKKVEATLKTPQGEQREDFDAVIVAIGVVGNTDNLGLEHTKVVVEKNQIKVNEWRQTHEPGVYAIGDVAGAPWLAHKASHEGVLVADKIAGLPSAHPIKASAIPGCTYSNPQIASIGMTQRAAEAWAETEGRNLKIGHFPFVGNGKAIALGEPEGMMKTIFDAKSGELLGAHLIGAEVTEMIQGFAIAITAELTEEDLMHTIFPHPTLSEMMHESTLDAFGRVIHY